MSRARITSAFALVLGIALVPIVAPPAHALGNISVNGVLTDSAGDIQPGAQVDLVLWPSPQSLAATAIDGDIDTEVVGSTVTDETGAFSFYASESMMRRFRAASSPDGIIDLTVESEAGGEWHSYGLSRVVGTDALPLNGPQPDGIDVDPVVLQGIETPGPDPDATTAPAGTPGCMYKKTATLGPRWVGLTTAWITTKVSAGLTYKKGSSTSIGIGASTGGAFKMSGSTTIASSVTVTFADAANVAGRTWRTEYVFARFEANCYGTKHVQVRAVSFAGGASNLTPSGAPPTATFCTVYSASSNYVLDHSTSSAISASTAADIGINLTATTGYSSNTKLSYRFAAGKRLCGTKGYPGGAAPGTLVAKI